MNKLKLLLVSAGLCTSMIAPVTADEIVVKNDSIVNINSAVSVADFLAGEQVGARLTAPADGVIVAVQVLWMGFPPGDGPRQHQAIHIHDANSFPMPGTELATIANPILVSGGWNEFRYEDSGQTVPLGVIVESGDEFDVTLEFATGTNIAGGEASVVRDTDGCQTGKNTVFVIPGGWTDLCPQGVTGDVVIRAVLEDGPLCHTTLPGDSNGDCYVNMDDFDDLATNWLKCNNVADPNCL